MKYLIGLGLLVLACNVHAGEFKLLLGSYHLPQAEDCEFNPGFGYTYDNGITVMAYKNSQCNLGVLITLTERISDRFSYSWGGALGYDYATLVPTASLNMKVGNHGFVGVIPGFLIEKDTIFFYGVYF